MSRTENKRPKLGAVLRGEQSAQEARLAPEPAPSAPAKRGELVQLNVTVSAELRKRVRLKALQEDREVTAVVRELLQRWVDEG